MNVKIKYAISQKKVEKLIPILLKNSLHMGRRGTMRDWCDYPEDVKIIAIAYINGIPVGAGMVVEIDGYFEYNIGVYVRRAFRKNGIGTKILKVLQKRDKSEWYSYTGTKAASKLYGKTGKKRQKNQSS